MADKYHVIPFNDGWLNTATGRWLPAIAGADDDPEPDPKPDPDPEPDPKPDPDPDPEPDDKAVLRAENQRLKREAAEREKERRKAERDAAKASDERKAEQGEWKKLAEERASRITELEGQIQERDRKDAERDQRSTVDKAAERLNFRRPRRAYALLVDELGGIETAADTLADEQLVEAALKRLVKDDQTLVDTQRRSGAPVGGRGNGPVPAEQESAEFVLGLLGKTPQ